MFHHGKAKPVQGAQSFRMVSQDLYVSDTELAEDLSADTVQAQVRPHVHLLSDIRRRPGLT